MTRSPFWAYSFTMARLRPTLLCGAAMAVALLGGGCQEVEPARDRPPMDEPTPTEQAPMEHPPAPDERFNVVELSGGFTAYNEVDASGRQFLVIETPSYESRMESGAYPVSFRPDASELLIVSASREVVAGLEALSLDGTGSQRRITNAAVQRRPGPLPRTFVPPPTEGEWINNDTFRYRTDQQVITVNVNTGEIESD